ncbi:MAG: transglutaminase-like domain-containing protein [Methylacidiphilales bacterium]|nr:transglutaminase-like domain-containing protein [Candidatus Methylacidiphilales bacterium]
MQILPRRNQASRSNGQLPRMAALVWLLMGPALYAQPISTNGANTPVPHSGTTAPVFEQWSVLVMENKQCGFGSTITTENDTPGGKQFHTVEVEEFVATRDLGGQVFTMKITSTSKVTEDADGVVLNFEQETSGAGSDIVSSGTREGDDLVVTSRGQTQRYHIPPLSALGPEKVRQQTLLVPLKPGQTFTFNTFDGEYPQAPVVVKGTVVGQEMRNVRGTERQLWRLTSEASIMPGLTSTSWVDDKSNDVESLTVIPGIGDLYEFVTDRAECMKQPEGAEIFASTLIHPNRAIPEPQKLAQAVYRISCSDQTKPLTLWDGGEQKVLTSSPGTSEIEVTVPAYTPADATWQLPHIDTPELHQFLQPTSYLEVNSPEIQKLASEAVGNEKNPVKAAQMIESFVRAYIYKKDLNIGFASAEETAKSHEGDCTEHAVLCAAIGRAAGLPTRCVVGLGYIPPGVDEPAVSDQVDTDTGIFGFHMWAEAWIGPDQWVPMDAALDGFDVGHIAITKTALEEINPLVDLNAPILQLMQNLKVEVLKTVPKNRATTTPPSGQDTAKSPETD